VTTEGSSAAATSKRTKLALLVVLAPSLVVLEWGLVAVTAALVAYLSYIGFSTVAIWLLLWGLNLLYSGAVVLFSDRSQIDITLMETLRRWTDALAGRWRLSAGLLEAVIVLRLLFWDGPCRLLIYLRPRLPSPLLQGVVFVGASGLQMFVWVWLYVLGYESVGELIGKLW
jgi:hypothetical protein